MTSDYIQIRGQRAARWIKEPVVDGIGIGTANQPQRRHVVGRRHPGVGRMELILPPTPLQLGRDRIDPLGDDEHRTVRSLCEEIAQRPLEAPRQHDALAFLRDERK